MSTTDAATPPEDPAAPLEAYVQAAARRRLGGISDECKLVGRMMDCPDVTVGDLRRAAAAIRDMQARLELCDESAYLAEHAAAVEAQGRAEDAEAEIKRLRDERDAALRMFAKAKWRGPWTLTPAEWVSLGRKMAGLKAEENP